MKTSGVSTTKFKSKRETSDFRSVSDWFLESNEKASEQRSFRFSEKRVGTHRRQNSIGDLRSKPWNFAEEKICEEGRGSRDFS